jgi:hypothetical protein
MPMTERAPFSDKQMPVLPSPQHIFFDGTEL